MLEVAALGQETVEPAEARPVLGLHAEHVAQEAWRRGNLAQDHCAQIIG